MCSRAHRAEVGEEDGLPVACAEAQPVAWGVRPGASTGPVHRPSVERVQPSVVSVRSSPERSCVRAMESGGGDCDVSGPGPWRSDGLCRGHVCNHLKYIVNSESESAASDKKVSKYQSVNCGLTRATLNVIL